MEVGGRKERLNLQEARGALLPLLLRPDAHALEHEVEALPAASAAVRAEHGMRAQDVHLKTQVMASGIRYALC